MPTSYLLKVTLCDTPNTIWRRFIVPSDIFLDNLHDVLQTVMGWHDCHFHSFIVGQKQYLSAAAMLDGALPEEKAMLAEIAPKKGAKFHYVYDFGDNWEHEIAVENTDYSHPDWPYPVCCIEGIRACPPDDCGGVFGFVDFCEAMADKKHPEHKELKEWYGGKYDPDHFDLAKVNKGLGVKPVKPKKQSESQAKEQPAEPKTNANKALSRIGKTLKKAAQKKEPVVKKTVKKSAKKKTK